MKETRDGTVIGLDVAWQAPIAEWTASERTELATLRHELERVAPPLDWDGGATDAGDPWIVATNPATDEVVLHIARIGRTYAALDETLSTVATGHGLRGVLEACLQNWRPAMLSFGELSRPLRLSPAAMTVPAPEGVPFLHLGEEARASDQSGRTEGADDEARLEAADAGSTSQAQSPERHAPTGTEPGVLDGRVVVEPKEPIERADGAEPARAEEEEAAAYVATAREPVSDEATVDAMDPAAMRSEPHVESATHVSRGEAAPEVTAAAPAGAATLSDPANTPLPDNVIRIDFTIPRPKGDGSLAGDTIDGSVFVTVEGNASDPNPSLSPEDLAPDADLQSGLALGPIDNLVQAVRNAVLDRFDFTDEAVIEVIFDAPIFGDVAPWQTEGAEAGAAIEPTFAIPDDSVFIEIPEADALIFG
ncbi:MAG: hypothetical protein AAF371_04415 [Pseudomonadota bacterium]